MTRLLTTTHPLPMSKQQRHTAIRELIQTHRVSSQEQLRELLDDRGFEVTQATLSRDIRELKLIKVHDPEGGTHYTLPPESWDNAPALTRLLPALYIGAEGTGNLLIVKTMVGGAQAVAEAIDWEEWHEVLGTLAGDDTILLILRDADQLDAVLKRLEDRAGVTE
ncbi:MAG TPA: arginine repressor [Longimicrobiales bacterium]|nr:arginine repressor [Longimicrobiales bacterium]